MDATTAERINMLAKNLKELHLAASMDEAFEKAKEIIIGTQGSTPVLNEVVQEEQMLFEAVRLAEEEAHDEQEVQDISSTIEEVKQDAQAEPTAEMDSAAVAVSEQLKKEREELARIKVEIEASK